MIETRKIGHIYVVLLDGGIVKTGRTKNPSSRISRSGFGNREIVDFWVSDEFVGCCQAETEMINFLKDIGHIAFGKEYFTGVDYMVAVEKARSVFEKHSTTCVKTAKLKKIDAENRYADAVIYALSNPGADREWIDYTSRYLFCAKAIGLMFKNRGLSWHFTDENDHLGGLSHFELSILLRGYKCEDGSCQYFSEIAQEVASMMLLDDSDMLESIDEFKRDLIDEVWDAASEYGVYPSWKK